MARVPGLPRADGVAEAASPLGFQINAPVTVVQRPDGLTLRGREGEIHIVTAAAPSPADWMEAALGGVSVSQALAGEYDVDMTVPWESLTNAERDYFLHGTGRNSIEVTYRNRYGRTRS